MSLLTIMISTLGCDCEVQRVLWLRVPVPVPGSHDSMTSLSEEPGGTRMYLDHCTRS